MTSDSQKTLQSYMFQSGDHHSVINIIKSFLNSSSANSINNLKTDNEFDEQTKSALADFQTNKGLNPTGGMNLKTWLAIGAEMNPIQINLVSMTDQTVRDLLQMGYRSKFPFRKVDSNNPSGISGAVQKTSLNFPGGDDEVKGNFTFSVYITVFAPFDWFGPLNASRGDGNNRRFGYKLSETYRLRAESIMTASPGHHKYPWSVTKAAEATTSYLLRPISVPTGVLGVNAVMLGEVNAKSEGTISDEDTGEAQTDGLKQKGDSVRYHFYGNDDAFALWGDDSWLTSDIDIHADIKFKYDTYSQKPNTYLMHVSGHISGDQFPAVETYMRDGIGNGVMLGVWQVREGDGPVFNRSGGAGIPGDKKLPMIDIDVSVIVENGVFTGIQKNSRIISLVEHNKPFIDLLTVDTFYKKGMPIPIPRPTPTPQR